MIKTDNPAMIKTDNPASEHSEESHTVQPHDTDKSNPFTLANTGEPYTVDGCNRAVQLKETGFIGNRTKNDLAFLSADYDKFFTNIEIFNSGMNVVSTITTAVTIGVTIAGAVPSMGATLAIPLILVLGRGLITNIATSFTKQQELSYICSACLGFVANIMSDVKDYTTFYNSDVVAEYNKNNDTARLERNAQLFTATENNLYKFLFFLLNYINFTQVRFNKSSEPSYREPTGMMSSTLRYMKGHSTDNQGGSQFIFWNGLLQRIDFATYRFTPFFISNADYL